MAKLTSAYIQAHEGAVHSYASFGECVFQALLAQAKQVLGDTGEADSLNLSIEFTMSPFMPTDCIKICLTDVHGVTWCMNQQDDRMYEE